MNGIMQGNEAIAWGAWEAGARVGCAYPGTPSSEIMAELSKYPEVVAGWSPKAKVAHGASVTGGRAIACMKHAGLNVASDPLMTASYARVKGGLVVVLADDPGRHSSQNEQDSRHWARFGKMPMLEPADSQECKDFAKIAFAISERFDAPVILRSETRASYCDSAVDLSPREEATIPLGLDQKQTPKYVIIPGFSKARRVFVEERMARLPAYADSEFPFNSEEMGDPAIGFISSGASCLYAKDLFPEYSFLKLGMVWPLPWGLIGGFFKKVKKVIVAEELDPFLETEITAKGCKVWRGKDLVSAIGKLSPAAVEQALVKAVTKKTHKALRKLADVDALPKRPPNLCAGCSRRPLFCALKKLGLFVFGEIGCYGLGDSTFLHGGVAPVMDAAYNKSYSTTIISDNRVTAMTGQQEHPGTGFTVTTETTNMVDYETLVRAPGVKHVRKVNPYDLKGTMEIVKEEVNRNDASVVMTENSPCMLLCRAQPLAKFVNPLYTIDVDKWRGCKACLEINCSAMA